MCAILPHVPKSEPCCHRQVEREDELVQIFQPCHLSCSILISTVREDWFEDGVISTGGNADDLGLLEDGVSSTGQAEMAQPGLKMESLAQEIEGMGRARLKKTAAVQNPAKMGRTGSTMELVMQEPMGMGVL